MKQYVVVLGDTAEKIAIRCTGDPSRGPQLMNANICRCVNGQLSVYPDLRLDLPQTWGKAPSRTKMMGNAQALLRATAVELCSRGGRQSDTLDNCVRMINVCHQIILECRP